MEYDLIPDEVYGNLPDEPNEKFALLAKVARANLVRLLDVENSSSEYYEEVRSQFIETMREAAIVLNIDGLPLSDEAGRLSSYDEFRFFNTRLSAIVTRIRLRSELVSKPNSVQLGRITKARIRQEAEQLRRYINDSDLPSDKKKSVSIKLDQLLAEIDKTRLSFAVVTAITAAIATTISGGVSAIAKAPDAYQVITNILAYIGDDKEKEDAERERLAPPPMALPPPPKSNFTTASFGGGFPEDLDEDVPF